MSDGDLLLSAVREHSEEDVPRLMYADWLDEHQPDAFDVSAALRGPDGARVAREVVASGVAVVRIALRLAGGRRWYVVRLSDNYAAWPIIDELRGVQAMAHRGTSDDFGTRSSLVVRNGVSIVAYAQVRQLFRARYGLSVLSDPEISDRELRNVLSGLFAGFGLPALGYEPALPSDLAVWVAHVAPA